MGLIEAIKSPVVAQLMSDTERQERYIKQLEAEIDVLKRSFSQDKWFVVTQNKVLAGRLKKLENSVKWLHTECQGFSYFRKAWNNHISRMGL